MRLTKRTQELIYKIIRQLRLDKSSQSNFTDILLYLTHDVYFFLIIIYIFGIFIAKRETFLSQRQ